MEYQIKLNPIQKIAIFWLQKIDSQLLLYKQLISLPQAFRIFLYAALVGFTYFALKFTTSIIGGYFDTAPMPEAWYFLGNVIFYTVMVGMSLIFTLESLNNCNVPQIFAEIKQKKAEIKAKKLQFFRLRNMHIFFRILIYIFFYMFLVFLLQTSFISLMIDIAQTTTLNQEQLQNLSNEYKNILGWFTFIYLLSALGLDYTVNKKRAQTKGAKHEVITA